MKTPLIALLLISSSAFGSVIYTYVDNSYRGSIDISFESPDYIVPATPPTSDPDVNTIIDAGQFTTCELTGSLANQTCKNIMVSQIYNSQYSSDAVQISTNGNLGQLDGGPVVGTITFYNATLFSPGSWTSPPGVYDNATLTVAQAPSPAPEPSTYGPVASAGVALVGLSKFRFNRKSRVPKRTNK